MNDNELLYIMEKCGHFLYHRRGGKRGQARILRLMSERGPIVQKELIEALSLKSGSVSETVGKLEAAGYITKERDPKDRRRMNLVLTHEGKAFAEEWERQSREQEAALFTALTDDDKGKLAALLTRLLEDWQSKFDSDLFNHRGGKRDV